MSSNESNVPRPQELYELLNDYFLCSKNGIPTRINEIFQEILHDTKCEANVSNLVIPCLIYDYSGLINIFLESHVKDIQTKGVELSDEELLSFHKERWENFESASRHLDELCSELYEHCEDASHRVFFYRIYKMAINAWEQHTEKFTEHVIETVIKMIDNERRGKKVNKPLIEVTMRLLKENMRLKSRRPATMRYKRLELIPPLLDKTEDRYMNTMYSFYKTASSRLLKQNSLLDYLKKAISIIFTEQFICTNAYLMPPDVVNYITMYLSQVLIHDNNSVITTYFDELLNECEIRSLRLFYFCLKALPDPKLLQILSTSLCNNIKSNGEQIMKQCSSNDGINAKLYIENILKMRRIYSDLVRITFESDEEFEKAYRMATRYIVNDIPSKTKSTAEAAKLLASHCIKVLKTPENLRFYLTDDLHLLFKYSENKHIFEEAFYQLLVSSLMWETPKDFISFKREIITFIKLCSDATRSFAPDQMIRGMIKDIETSSVLTNDFSNRMEIIEESDIELQFKILREGIWPFVEKTLPIIIPENLSYQIELFSQFYKIKNTQKKLTWLHYMFEAQVHSYCFKKEHIFSLDVVQAAVLLKFNEANYWSFNQMQIDTKIEKQILNQAIDTFIEANILITKSGENSEDSCVDRILEMNLDYEGKNEHITLTKLSQQTQATTPKKNNFIISEESKFFAIQAAVTRIMKKKLTAKHEELAAEVFKDMSSKFDFTPALFDKSIDKLISLEVIERSEEDCNQYKYIP